MIVYNGGSYDLIHSGHIYALRQCRDIAGPNGTVVIALNRDDFIAQFKGHAPVQPYEERAAVLRAIRYVDRVVPNVGGADSRPTLEVVQPDIIAVGADWYSDDDSRYCAQMGFTREWLREHFIRLRYLSAKPGHSSTNLRATAARIAAQPTPAALVHERMLDA